MREILFRAWHPESKVMIEFNGNDFKDMYKAHHFGLLVNNEHPEGKNLLMQFTGLHDKNGVKIFEGDIVLAFCNINKISDPHLAPTRDPEYNKKIVGYGKGGFYLYTEKYSFCGVLGYSGSTMPENLEVIGNIHQNDDLLK